MLATVEQFVNSYFGAGALGILVAVGLLAALVARPLARRWATSRAAATMAVLSVVAIVAVTLGVRFHGDLRLTFQVGWLYDDFLLDRLFDTDGEWLLNVVLFFPAGLFVARATRRPLRTAVGLVVLSFAIELVQGFTNLGFADPADLVANAIGAVAGALVGAVLGRWWPVRPERRWPRRAALFTVIAVIAAAGIGWLGAQAAANTSQTQLADRLTRAFDGTTSADVTALMITGDGRARLSAMAGSAADYVARTGASGEWEGRWSTDVLALYRCVYVRWSATAVTVSNAAIGGCAGPGGTTSDAVTRQRPLVQGTSGAPAAVG